jgi:hypothetical protein
LNFVLKNPWKNGKFSRKNSNKSEKESRKSGSAGSKIGKLGRVWGLGECEKDLFK